MPNMMDAENAIMKAHARFENWQRDFNARWYKPMVETMLLVTMKQMPEEVKAALAARKPEQMKVVTDWIESIRNGGG